MQIAVLGIDLGKNSCSVAGLDATGRVILRRRMRRDGVVKLAAGLPSSVTLPFGRGSRTTVSSSMACPLR